MAKAKKRKWFKPLRGSYIPVNSKGALTYIPFVSYLVATALVAFWYIDSKAIATLVVIVGWVIGSYVMTVFARSKSS